MMKIALEIKKNAENLKTNKKEYKKKILEKDRERLILLGKNLKRIRKEKGISQEELALSLGNDNSYISRIESASSNPSFTVVCKIIEKLGVTFEDLQLDIDPDDENQ